MKNNQIKNQKIETPSSFKKQNKNTNTLSIKKTAAYTTSENTTNQKYWKKQMLDKNQYPNTPSIPNKYYHNNNFLIKTRSYSKPISPKNKTLRLLSYPKGKKNNDSKNIDKKKFLPTPRSLFESSFRTSKDNNKSKICNLSYIPVRNSRNNNNKESTMKNNINLLKKNVNIKKCFLNNLNNNLNNNKYIIAKNINNVNNDSICNCFIHTIIYKKNDSKNSNSTFFNDLIENSTNFNSINNEYHNNNINSYNNSIDNNSNQKNIYKNSKDFHDSNEIHNLFQLKNNRNNKSENKQQLNNNNGIKGTNNLYHSINNHNCYSSSCCKLEKKNNNIFIAKSNNEKKFLETKKNIIKLYYEKNAGIFNNKAQSSIYHKKILKNKNNEKILNKTPNKTYEAENLRIKNRAKTISRDFLIKYNGINLRGSQNLSYIQKEDNKGIINYNKNKKTIILSKNTNINKKEANKIQKNNNNSYNSPIKNNKIIFNKYSNHIKTKLIPSLKDNKKNNNIKIINHRFKNRIKIKLFVNKKPKTFLKIKRRKTLDIDLLTRKIKKECDICHKIIDSHLFKIHYNSHPSKIFTWLYLGSFANACDIKELKFNGINKILNCAIECHNTKLPRDIEEMHLYIKDSEKFNIFDYFEKANNYINKCKLEGGKLLVHCKFGISRSASFIIAYLIKYNNFTTDNALLFLQRKRNKIKPNQGFMNQLYQYEKYLKNKTI